MKNIPRILPLVGVAVVGVLAVNLLSGARSLPELFASAAAFAEEVPGQKAMPEDAKPVAAKLPPPVCAPTAAELAKEAGLSPAELRVLQSLGARRGELDVREGDIDLQMQLLAAAEAKLDAKMKALNGLKGDITVLLGQVDTQTEAEVTRLVAVFSAMKAKDAAARMTVLDDSVRLPIAAKMKERTLAMMLAQMPPAEAKRLTESLARRFAESRAIAEGKAAVAPEPATKPPAKPAATAEAKPPAAKPAAKAG
jgi:flagellar motility protein MotE (MotC chaperone)